MIQKQKRYKVRYYSLGNLRSKIFNSFHEATLFAVYKIRAQDIHEFYMLDD
jgi:hypothetical protein